MSHRAEQREKEEQSSQQLFEEIIRGWTAAHEKEVHQDLLEALENQQRLCAAVIRDKKSLINDLKQVMQRSMMRCFDGNWISDCLFTLGTQPEARVLCEDFEAERRGAEPGDRDDGGEHEDYDGRLQGGDGADGGGATFLNIPTVSRSTQKEMFL